MQIKGKCCGYWSPYFRILLNFLLHIHLHTFTAIPSQFTDILLLTAVRLLLSTFAVAGKVDEMAYVLIKVGTSSVYLLHAYITILHKIISTIEFLFS